MNILAGILFVLPARYLDLFYENYSTLSLNARGYLYLLSLGIMIGLIFCYETYRIEDKKHGILAFASLLMGTIVPHHIPYNLQGNLHLLFAYLGFTLLAYITIRNILRYGLAYRTRNKNMLGIYVLCLELAAVSYFRRGMVNTFSEMLVMLGSMLCNYLVYYRIEKIRG